MKIRFVTTDLIQFCDGMTDRLGETKRLVWHSEDRASYYILIAKPTRCTNFSNLIFGMELYMFRTVSLCPSSGVQHCTRSNRYISYRTYMLCWLLASSSQQNLYDICLFPGLLMNDREQAVSKTCMTYTYCCVYSAGFIIMDRETVRNM